MDTRDTRETGDELGPAQAFEAAHAAVAVAQRRLFDTIVRCDRAGLWRADGCRDMAQWLSGRLGISNWAARRWVAAAHALAGLPGVAAAFESGALGVDKVVELTRFATPESEDKLITWARRVAPATVRHKADLAARRDITDIRRMDGARGLRGWWDDEGRCYGLEGWFGADQGVVIEKALNRLAQRLPEDPEHATSDDGSPLSYESRNDARRADALFVMASRAIAADGDPKRAHGGRPRRARRPHGRRRRL
jgi:hypothetical protein